MTGKSMKEAILDAAEKRVRHAGYSNMSFRDVAKDVGIKSASVHYHFPTKSDLGTALVERYKDHFSQKLLQIDTTNFSDALAKFVQLYDAALVMDQSICLCAALGAESMGIEKQIRAETGVFFQVNIEWLQSLFRLHPTKATGLDATDIVASLEGAMLLASTTGDRTYFKKVSDRILHRPKI